MKVLFSTDGSEASFYTIKKTLPFLKDDYQIDIVNIVDLGFFPTYVTFPNEEEDGFPSQKSISQEVLDKTRKLIESEGYKVTRQESFTGHPADIILELIHSENYDLVTLGSHGKKGIRRWLGSVSRKVVTKSPIPTLIARPPKESKNIEFKGSKEVLISVDGSEYSYNAIKRTLNLLNLQNSSIEIVTVRPGVESLPLEITMDNEWLENCLIKQKEIANEILQESKKILEINGYHPKATLSLEGDAADQILKYIEENRKDLVVMGSHGREGISDILLGSVSKRVLDNSICPVLIIPTKKEASH